MSTQPSTVIHSIIIYIIALSIFVKRLLLHMVETDIEELGGKTAFEIINIV